MIVVSDNSVLSCLAEIGELDLLRRLYGKITITETIRHEAIPLLTDHSALGTRHSALLPLRPAFALAPQRPCRHGARTSVRLFRRQFQRFSFQHFRIYSPMADVFTPQKRSEVMSRIRGRDTKPELALRSMLHRLGYRFTVNGPKNRFLPGKPDIVLPKHRTVVFVHGCFWHGHEHCPAFRLPSARRAWWKRKIEGNRARDLRTENALRAQGWHVVTVWECALRTRAARLWLEHRLPKLTGP